MKRLSITLSAIFLAILFTVQASVQVVGAVTSTEYISEVKVFMAKEEKDAKSALQSEGYTLLDCNLNQDAEGGWGSKGKKATYLGYKTTTESSEAVTDLAVMNMKGGYSTEDYESLMDQYIHGEIEPFLDDFIAAIKEYRENYNSDNAVNKARAGTIHDLLNKYKDDDTGQYLGDLLLNETKYEMGDDAYDSLSDEQKNSTADLVTIFAQANGQATLMIENLITRGSDTNDNTWIDRFSGTTYDDLVDDTGKTPTDAKNELAQQYDDDANAIVDDLWDNFKEVLEGYDDALENADSYDSSAYEAACEDLNSLDENASDEEKEEVYNNYFDELEKKFEYEDDVETIAIHDYLSEIEYEDGTLLDFFLQDTDSDDFDITCIYPIVASLTDGQRSGIEFVSLKELCAMAFTDEDGYSRIDVSNVPETSVYDGVDREIYDKGGVAVTSDALRTDALSKMNDGKSKLSDTTVTLWVVTGLLTLAFATTATAAGIYATNYAAVLSQIESVGAELGLHYESTVLMLRPGLESAKQSTLSGTTLCTYLSVGLAVVTIIMAAISIWQTYEDLKEYYNVDLTPQPRYMVEEEDITAYNKKGEKIVVKNQSAYYKIVQTNRSESDSNYENLGTGNDINGDVGQQWLTLYAVRMEGNDPILASSLKTVVKSTEIPTGYSTGIHMFGEDNAYNLNNTNFVWDDDAPSIYVYYKTDDSASAGGTANESGSSFTMGHLALVGGICLIFSSGLTAVIMTVFRKRKEKKTESKQKK